MWNEIFKAQCHTVMEPNMALSATCISFPLTINLSLPLPSHLKYNVSYSIIYQKLTNSSYTGK